MAPLPLTSRPARALCCWPGAPPVAAREAALEALTAGRQGKGGKEGLPRRSERAGDAPGG